MDQENILLLDVRPEEEYRFGHISKALSIPYDQLAARIKRASP